MGVWSKGRATKGIDESPARGHIQGMDWITTLTLGGTVIGTGIALAATIVPGMRELRRDIGGLHRDIGGLHRDIGGLHRDIGELRERMARLEGLFQGFTGRGKEGPGHLAE